MKKRFNRIYIEITNKCNLSCSFCKKGVRPLREMTINEFKKIISKIKDYTNTICLHVKGEPLLYSNLNEILTICDDNNINISLTTNGTLLKAKVEDLIKHKALFKIHISLNAEVKNLNYLDDIFTAGSLFPQDKIIIYRLWAQKENKNTKIDINKYVDKNNLFEWPKVSNAKTNGFCEGLKSQLAILSNGTVTACCLDDEGLINLGNIFEEDLKEILEKEKTKKIIEGFRDNKCVEKLCQSCYYKKRFNK